jgi:ATP-dependent Clp protease protease subunit
MRREIRNDTNFTPMRRERKILNKNDTNEIMMPPHANVSRVNRKVFFTGEVEEESIHELIKILHEIELEDEMSSPQNKVEKLINELMDVATIQDLQPVKKEELKLLEDAVNTFKVDKVEDRLPVHIYINTYGGSIYEALEFADYVRIAKMPIYTYSIGKTMSAGVIMLVAGDKRFAMQNTRIVIHQISGGVYGTLQKMLDYIDETQKQSDMINDYLILTTKITEELLQEIQEKQYDYYISAQDALELEIVDEII